MLNKWGLFFKDQEAKPESDLFTIASLGNDSSGVKYIRDVVKFSSLNGYTGQSVQQKKIIFYEQSDPMNKKEDKKGEVNFEYEIDNFVLETDFKTAIFSPLMDADGNKFNINNIDQVQGVIQLINLKKDSELHNESYLNEFRHICKVIGTSIKNCSHSLHISAKNVQSLLTSYIKLSVR